MVSSGAYDRWWQPNAIWKRRGWDSNPRNGLPLGRYQGACTSPLCDLAQRGLKLASSASIQILADSPELRASEIPRRRAEPAWRAAVLDESATASEEGSG